MTTSESKTIEISSFSRRDSPRFWLRLLALALAVRLLFLAVSVNNGTDAWARLSLARMWLRDPWRLPSDVWLPLHFWLLGILLWLGHFVWVVQTVMAVLGALTVVALWGTLRRSFDSTVAGYAAVAFALFGFHIGYSVTTSSEGPTLFFLVTGVYFWVRLHSERHWRWVLPAGGCFSAACLCRFDAWAYVPVLGVLLLDLSGGIKSAWADRSAWKRALGFTLAASAGAVGWLAYSLVKWGDALAAPHKTFFLNLHADIQQPLAYRAVVVPGALFVSLSPLILGLAIVGLAWSLFRGTRLARSLAVACLVVGSAHYYSAVAHSVTQARYTLMYSWLLIPFGFAALRFLADKWPALGSKNAFRLTLGFFLLWEVGILVGAEYGPRVVADRLSVMAPTLPLRGELRDLTAWLRQNRLPGEAAIVDEFHGETDDIVRFARIPDAEAYGVRRRALDETSLHDFILEKHPRLLVYAPSGGLGRAWSLGDGNEVIAPGLDLRLRRVWEEVDYRIYAISYPSGK